MGLGAYHGLDDSDRRQEIVDWFIEHRTQSIDELRALIEEALSGSEEHSAACCSSDFAWMKARVSPVLYAGISMPSRMQSSSFGDRRAAISRHDGKILAVRWGKLPELTPVLRQRKARDENGKCGNQSADESMINRRPIGSRHTCQVEI